MESNLYLDKIIPNKPFVIYENNKGDYNQYIVLERATSKVIKKDQYFLKIYKKEPHKDYDCQGYIYFYLDLEDKASQFIGIYVKPEERNANLATLLTASWVRLCFDNGILNLKTNKKQRKPALLYLLKKFYFEITNINNYETSPFTIFICDDKLYSGKSIYFKNKLQKEQFRKSSIMEYGDYNVLDELKSSTEIITPVLLSNTYFIQKDSEVYSKALKHIKNF